MVSVQKRESESSNALIFRFTKKVRRSGVILETRRRRFQGRPLSRRKRRLSAVYKDNMRKDLERQKKFGLI